MNIKDKIKNAKESHLFDELSEKEKFEAILEGRLKVRLIAELDEIKTEINNIKDLDIVVLEDGSDGYDDFVKRDFIVQILDNHISELKGE